MLAWPSGPLQAARAPLEAHLSSSPGKWAAPHVALALLAHLVLGAALVVLLGWLAPSLLASFAESGVSLPVPTRIALSLSGALTSGWFIGVAAAVVLVGLDGAVLLNGVVTGGRAATASRVWARGVSFGLVLTLLALALALFLPGLL